MRKIAITQDCIDFLNIQDERVQRKFYQLIEVIGEVKTVHSNIIKKLQNTQFYELRIRAGNEYRIVIFAIDHLNFSECNQAICLYGFHKKSNKDYKKALIKAEKILNNYLNNSDYHGKNI